MSACRVEAPCRRSAKVCDTPRESLGSLVCDSLVQLSRLSLRASKGGLLKVMGVVTWWCKHPTASNPNPRICTFRLVTKVVLRGVVTNHKASNSDRHNAVPPSPCSSTQKIDARNGLFVSFSTSQAPFTGGTPVTEAVAYYRADGCSAGLVPRPTFATDNITPKIACQEPAVCGTETLAVCCADGPACGGTDAGSGAQLACVDGLCEACGLLGMAPCEGANYT